MKRLLDRQGPVYYFLPVPNACMEAGRSLLVKVQIGCSRKKKEPNKERVN